MPAAREEKSTRRSLAERAWHALAPPLGLRAQFCEGEQCRRFTVAHSRLRRDGIFITDAPNGVELWLCSPQCFERALLAIIKSLESREHGSRAAAQVLPRMPHHLALLNKGIITEADLQEAQQHAERSGLRLGEALLSLSLVSEDQLAEAYARENGCGFYKNAPTPIMSAAMLPRALSLRFGAVTVHARPERTLLGFTRHVDRGLLAMAAQMCGGTTEACIITERHLRGQVSVDRNLSTANDAVVDIGTASASVAAYAIARQAERLGSERVRLAGSSGLLWVRFYNDPGDSRRDSGKWQDSVFVTSGEIPQDRQEIWFQ